MIRGGATDWESFMAGLYAYILVGDGTDVNSVAVSGDVALAANGQMRVVGLQNRTLAPDAPVDGDAVVWDAAASQWEPAAVGGGGVLRVTNSSGGAAAANDVGYIDAAGEYQTTSTVYDDVAWCVVATGGANGATIVVAVRGNATIELDGNCSIGDYIYTSATPGRGHPESYFRHEAFAIATTANVAGAGGTCSALLLTHTQPKYAWGPELFHILGHENTDFTATLNGAPVGRVVTYNLPLVSGFPSCIDNQSADEIAKMRLYNVTRATYALIESVNVGVQQITVTLAGDVAAWQNADTVTARSQTNTHFEASGAYFFDFEIDNLYYIGEPVRSVDFVFRTRCDLTRKTWFHPWETYDNEKVDERWTLNSHHYTATKVQIPLINRRFCWLSEDTGGEGKEDRGKLNGVNVAAP
jgi:hypothetical protein